MDSPEFNAVTVAEVPTHNVPMQDKIDYIYDFLKRIEPLMDKVEVELPKVLESAGPMLEAVTKNPMIKMLLR